MLETSFRASDAIKYAITAYPTNRFTFASRKIWILAAYASNRLYSRGTGTVIWNSKSPEARRR